MLKKVILSLFLFFSLIGSQSNAQTTAVDIYEGVERLNVLGTVLYIAAHPDDENTRLISYYASARKVRMGYLSITRGDGGQNLIGTEMREKLGLIRTNELLQARKIDGGHQFFTRANDFGYSKNPTETLDIWNKEEVLKDIVKVIREFKPDVIINRFDHKSSGRTHGHHTSSALLSMEAFDLAGDANYEIEGLESLTPWQPQRLFFNTSWWFYGSKEKFAEADKSNLYTLDAGVFYPMRGISNTEIAALSRSMHKSQGFGSSGSRGTEIEYLEYLKGSIPNEQTDPLGGINMTWSRILNSQHIEDLINDLIETFDFKNIENNIGSLIGIYKAISALDDSYWRTIKLAETQDLIVSCTGIYLAASTRNSYGTPGSELPIQIEIINRSHAAVVFNQVKIEGGGDPIVLNIPLGNNARKTLSTSFAIPLDHPLSNPYWINADGTVGLYSVDNPILIGRPMNAAAFEAVFDITIEGLPLSISRDIIYKSNDPVNGEIRDPYYILPKASVSFDVPVYIFPDRSPKEIIVKVKALEGDLHGALSLEYPRSWIVNPKIVDISLENKGEEQSFIFTVKGPFLSESAEFGVQILTNGGDVIKDEVTEIQEAHLPNLVIISPARAKCERISINKKGSKIAYVHGAGDDIPGSLEQIGYEVDILPVGMLNAENLRRYDALILGVRAYNTQPGLYLKRDVLRAYMESGGTVMVQYNTNRGVKGDDIAPYPMELSRDRVTDENAIMSFVDGTHEVLNYPNKISTRDFKNWVQERGLYFAKTWDSIYQTPIACSDPLEPLTKGSLLIAPVGKGYYIYTGLSWFRQLPAGVPGAYRLFTNLISIGKNGLELPQNIEESGNE